MRDRHHTEKSDEEEEKSPGASWKQGETGVLRKFWNTHFGHEGMKVKSKEKTWLDQEIDRERNEKMSVRQRCETSFLDAFSHLSTGSSAREWKRNETRKPSGESTPISGTLLHTSFGVFSNSPAQQGKCKRDEWDLHAMDAGTTQWKGKWSREDSVRSHRDSWEWKETSYLKRRMKRPACGNKKTKKAMDNRIEGERPESFRCSHSWL